jgi:hypothetical protein
MKTRTILPLVVGLLALAYFLARKKKTGRSMADDTMDAILAYADEPVDRNNPYVRSDGEYLTAM